MKNPVNSVGSRFGPQPCGLAWPNGTAGLAGPCQQRSVSTPTGRSPRLGRPRWRGRRELTDGLDVTRSAPQAPASCDVTTGQGGGDVDAPGWRGRVEAERSNRCDGFQRWWGAPVGDDGDRGVLRHTDDAGMVRGKPVWRRRTQRHGSPTSGDDGGGMDTRLSEE
jgi:hypothetical protein